MSPAQDLQSLVVAIAEATGLASRAQKSMAILPRLEQMLEL
jgi:hypothetical protein